MGNTDVLMNHSIHFCNPAFSVMMAEYLADHRQKGGYKPEICLSFQHKFDIFDVNFWELSLRLNGFIWKGRNDAYFSPAF
jgi:hypothetical protein